MAEKKLYREQKLMPLVWDSSHQNYNYWRFCVELWKNECDKVKIAKADRNYLLFPKLEDVKRDCLELKTAA